MSQAAKEGYELFIRTAQLDLTPRLGEVHRNMGCCEAHDCARHLLLGAAASSLPVRIRFGACWYDLADLGEAFLRCKASGRDIELYFDRQAAFDGKCAGELDQLMLLVSNGIRCLLVRGFSKKEHYIAADKKAVGGVGIHHAKWLLIGPMLIVGSANWTTSSKGNDETMMLVQLTEAGLADWYLRFCGVLAKSGSVLTSEQIMDAKNKLEQRRLAKAAEKRSEPTTSPDYVVSPYGRSRSTSRASSRTPSRSRSQSYSRASSRSASVSRSGSKRVSFRNESS